MDFKNEIEEVKMDSGEDAVGRWIQVYEKDLLSLFKRKVGGLRKELLSLDMEYQGGYTQSGWEEEVENIINKAIAKLEESCKK